MHDLDAENKCAHMPSVTIGHSVGLHIYSWRATEMIIRYIAWGQL